MENTQAEAVPVEMPIVQLKSPWSINNLWQGRIGGLGYFLGALSMGICFVIFSFVIFIIPLPTVRVLLEIAALALLILFDLTLIIRRCHDLDYSGWLALIMVVPFINFIFVLALLFMSGSEGSNKYGLPPVQGRKFFAEIFNY